MSVRTRSRGLALLVVIGILGVLAVLAVSFVTLARLERKASQQRLFGTRALLLARSGIEDATARLCAGQDPTLAATRFSGEDYNDDGILSPGLETDAQIFQPALCNREDCPARLALRPSFFVRDPSGSPALMAVDARPRGYTGSLSADHAYTLKVEDESAKINVNGGFLDEGDRDGDGIPDFRDPFVADTRTLPAFFPAGAAGIGRGWNAQLVRVLNTLGVQLGIVALGDVAIQNRPRGGYRNTTDVERMVAAASGLPCADLSPYLTVASWVDVKVVHPNAYVGELPLAPPIPMPMSRSDLKKARLPLRLEEGGRPPVNLNTATRPALIALLSGLQGDSWYTAYPFPAVYAIPPAQAPPIADAILAFRNGQEPFANWNDPAQKRPAPGPFSSWEQFAEFCDGLVPTVINGQAFLPAADGGDLEGASLLKAAFDPNTHLNKQLPDELMHYWIDKSDLTAWSTEGSLYPTGVFKVTAVGRVLGADGRLLAERSASQLTEAFSLLRQTSQKDFVGGRQPFQEYLSLSSDGVFWRTTGASDPSWKTWAKPVGLAVTTYPCHPLSLPGGNPAHTDNSADFDGAIALATVETPPDLPPDAAAPPRWFLHHFDDGWDAAVGVDKLHQMGPVLGGYPSTDLLLPGRLDKNELVGSVWPDATLPAPANEPNTLYPDGFHSQAQRSPAFSTLNFPPATFSVLTPGDPPVPSNHGVFSFWVKTSTLARQLLSCESVGATESQTMMAGSTTSRWGLLFENSEEGDTAVSGMVEAERVQEAKATGGYFPMPGLRWRLMTCFFDSAGDETHDLHVDVQGFPRNIALEDPQPNYHVPFDHPNSLDLFEHTSTFVLGWQYAPHAVPIADQVMDELALCDFGEPSVDAFPRTQPWVLGRYQDGRYYKGNDGAFLSSVLELEKAPFPRLLATYWTEHLPRDPCREALRYSLVCQYPVRDVDPLLGNDAAGLPKARVEVDLMTEGATLGDPALRSLHQGDAIQLPTSLSLPRLRYRVRFLTEGLDLNDPVLESPWFDDITFAYRKTVGPRILGWERP